MDKTVFISLPIEDLRNLIINCVNGCLQNEPISSYNQSQKDKLLTVEEAAKFLRLAVPTIYSKVSKGELPFMKRSKRLYFSKEDLIEYVKVGRSTTNDEVLAEADTYLKK